MATQTAVSLASTEPALAVAPETAPAIADPFAGLAYVLFHVRRALEDPDDPGRDLRWVRICRGRAFKDDTIGSLVDGGVGAFAEALSLLVELTLDLRELLEQGDAALALVETTSYLVSSSAEALEAAVGALLDDTSPAIAGTIGDGLRAVQDTALEVREKADYVPHPDDLRGLGYQLYRLLCIEQRPLPEQGAPVPVPASQVSLSGTGKFRLMTWGYGGSITTRGLGPQTNPQSKTVPVSWLGSRWLVEGASERASETWGTGKRRFEVFDHRFSSEPAEDLTELHSVLLALGYPVGTEKTLAGLLPCIRMFQKLNNLPVTGRVDNGTLNRLFHLDHAGQNLERAVPYQEGCVDPGDRAGHFQLANPGADAPEEQGIVPDDLPPAGVEPAGFSYPYYRAPARLVDDRVPSEVASAWALGRGWIEADTADPRDRDVSPEKDLEGIAEETIVPGFVALSSRARVRSSAEQEAGTYFHGGAISEGEAVGGFFFAARHTEPWTAGRQGTPTASLYAPETRSGSDDGKPPRGAVSRMYQWLPLDEVLGLGAREGQRLVVRAAVLMRSLYTDRERTAHRSDQGALRLELYVGEAFPGADGRRDVTQARKEKTRRTPLFPSAAWTGAAMTDQALERKRTWVRQVTEPMDLTELTTLEPGTEAALCVVLEGWHRSGWDIDAYFDDIRVWWEWLPEDDPMFGAPAE